MGLAWWGLAVLAVGALAGSGGSRRHATLRIRIRPRELSLERSPSVVISGLAPGQHVTVTATTDRTIGVERASATFLAGRLGAVALQTAPPSDGTDSRAGELGLLGVERVVQGRSHPAPTAGVIDTTLEARVGQAHATGTLLQRIQSAGVAERALTVAREGFVGRYIVPAHARDRTAVIVWGGSEGGIADSELQAETLAAGGIPALALAYFDEPGFPCSLSRIPIGYFASATRWLARRRAVDPRRIWALAGSRGSEAEFLLAAHWPGLLHGLITAPSSIGYRAIAGHCQAHSSVAWTVRGHALPRASTGRATVAADGAYDTRAAFLSPSACPPRARPESPSAAFEDLSCCWPEAMMSSGHRPSRPTTSCASCATIPRHTAWSSTPAQATSCSECRPSPAPPPTRPVP